MGYLACSVQHMENSEKLRILVGPTTLLIASLGSVGTIAALDAEVSKTQVDTMYFAAQGQLPAADTPHRKRVGPLHPPILHGDSEPLLTNGGNKPQPKQSQRPTFSHNLQHVKKIQPRR